MELIKIILSVIFCILFSCKVNESTLINIESDNAKYVLPYPVGESYYVLQAFNGPYTHHDEFKYAVDFTMPVGTVITSAREGEVVFVRDSFSDNENGFDKTNLVVILHTDSTFGRYVHITENGALVSSGMKVNVDDTIALSGSSGSPSYPHLHFDVTKTCFKQVCYTIPFYFKDIEDKNGIIKSGKYYTRRKATNK